jgi:Kef-type K+ transport system membrane component KefB
VTRAEVPDSHTLHRRDRTRKIIVPVALLTALLAVVLLVMVIAFQPHQVSVVGACMSIMLLLPLLVIMLLFQLVAVGMVWGVSRLYGKTGLWMGKARNVGLRVHIMTVKGSKLIARPVISMSAAFTQFETTAQSIRNTLRRTTDLPPKGDDDERK